MSKLTPWLLVAVTIAGMIWILTKPTPVAPPRPPAVIIHDTVRTIDTITLRREITKVLPADTVWLTREVVSAPETVQVVPPLIGLTALHQPKAIGDTGYAFGYMVRPLGAAHYSLRSWADSWVSPGPLGTVTLDSTGLNVGFWPPPAPPCTIRDDIKWAGIGAGSITLLRLLLGK